MAHHTMTDVELREKVAKDSTERLQKELVSKGSKLVADVSKLNRSELIEAVVELRKGPTLSAPASPARVAPLQVSGQSSTTDVAQLILLMFKDRDAREAKEKSEREAREAKREAREAREAKEREDREDKRANDLLEILKSNKEERERQETAREQERTQRLEREDKLEER